MPRLELTGTCLLAEQVDNVYVLSSGHAELSIEEFCWVDSSATLSWIRNEKPWKKFISDRVKRNRSVTDPHEWRYVPGSLNPADLPTRGLSGKDLPNRHGLKVHSFQGQIGTYNFVVPGLSEPLF